MQIKSLAEVKTTKKSIDIDLSEYPEQCSNVKLGKKLGTGYYYEDMGYGYGDEYINQTFMLFGKKYAHTINRNLCEAISGAIVPIFQIQGDLYALECENGEHRKAFICGKTKAVVFDVDTADVVDIDIEVKGHDIELFDNRVFVCENSRLLFSKKEDPTKFAVEEGGGYVCVDLANGMIVGAKQLNNSLYIFMQKAIYRLFAERDGKNYKLEAVPTHSLDIKANSLAKVNDIIYFVNGKSICSFDGKNVIEHYSYLNENECYSIKNCGELEGKYYLQGYYTNTKKFSTFIINPQTNEEYFSEGFEGLSKIGGLVRGKIDSNEIHQVTLNKNSKYMTFKTEEKDFGSPEKKTITCIKASSGFSARLVVYGDFGSMNFDFTKGYTKKKCNLTSQSFVFEIISSTKELLFGDMSIDYYVKGEE